MEPTATIHERKQLNLEIESAFIMAAESSVTIHRILQTKRGGTPLDAYEKFYNAFDYLVILTSDLKQLENEKDSVQHALAWISSQFDSDSDDAVLKRCKSGYEEFMAYKKLLHTRGVIALPAR